MMYLALRKSPPTGAGFFEKLGCRVIRSRLVSDYSHGGIVINGVLYHSTYKGGLHSLPLKAWTPERWDLFLLPYSGSVEARALDLFNKLKGAPYDWPALLSFIGCGDRLDRKTSFYCFEWCWLALTGDYSNGKVTPEKLLKLFIDYDSL